jgi:phage shock protein A
MEIVTMENNQPKVEETTQDTQLIHTVEEPPVVEVAITSEPGHLTPPTMVTDDLNKLNHQDLSLAEAINERIQLEVTKAVEEKINTLMSLATLNSGARQIIDPQNTDIDPNNDYADPGYNGDRTPKFPLNNRDQVLQAVSFFIGENNRDRYTGDQNSLIDKRISRAAAKFGLTEKDLTDFVNRAEAASEATEANTREESTMSDTINKPEMAASETASTSNELAATKKAIIDKLSSENASLKDQLNDLAKKMDDMTKNEQMRMKKDRAASRKKDMAKKLGEFDESMDSALASFVDEADDEEYTSFKAIAELIYDRGFTAGAQKIPSQEAIMASQGEPSPPTRKVTVIDPNPPAAMLPAPSGNPDTLKEGATVTTPFAPVAGSEMASSKKKNRFASL